MAAITNEKTPHDMIVHEANALQAPPPNYHTPEVTSEKHQHQYTQQNQYQVQQHQQQDPNQQHPQSATPLDQLGRYPAVIHCPNCDQTRLDITQYVSGNSNIGWAIPTCLLCGICCLIPLLISELKDVEHTCSNCRCLLAVKHRSGRCEVIWKPNVPAVLRKK